MRLLSTTMALSGALLLVSPANAATLADWENCTGKDIVVIIGGCTKIVEDTAQSAKSRSTAYFHRGNAHEEKGDNERALSDFSEAIKLDPAYAEAYAHRASIYFDMADYDRAIADLDAYLRLRPEADDRFAVVEQLAHLRRDLPPRLY